MENFFNAPNYPLFSLIIFVAIFGRYLIMSYLINALTIKSGIKPVMSGKRYAGQIRREIYNSFITSLIFAAGFVHLYFLAVNGKTLLLVNETASWSFHFLGILAALFIHETYYYWVHRLMHYPKFYRLFHKGHHDSVIVSTWTSFSFDPLESILQLLFFYILLFTIPLHLYSLLFLLIFMTVSAVINHLNYEIYPSFFARVFPFNLLIGATHHALHHKEFKTNYGLYFTFWDKIMKTESPHYQKQKSTSIHKKPLFNMFKF